MARLDSVSQNVTPCMFPVTVCHEGDSRVRCGEQRSSTVAGLISCSRCQCDVAARPATTRPSPGSSSIFSDSWARCVRSMMKDTHFFCRYSYHQGQKQPKLPAYACGFHLIFYPALHSPSFPKCLTSIASISHKDSLPETA